MSRRHSPGSIALWPTLAAACVIVAGQTGSQLGVDRLPQLPAVGPAGGHVLRDVPVALADPGHRAGRSRRGTTPVHSRAGHHCGRFHGARLPDHPLHREARGGHGSGRSVRRRRAAIAIVAAFTVAAVPLVGLQTRVVLRESGAVWQRPARNNPGARAMLPGFVEQADADAALLPAPENLGKDWATLPQPCSGALEPQDATLRRRVQRKTARPGIRARQSWSSAIRTPNSGSRPLNRSATIKGGELYAMLKGGCKPEYHRASMGIR